MISVGPLNMRNPVMLAACPLGAAPDTLRAAYDAGAGAVVTKSVTLEPRAGNPEPNMTKLPTGWILNWVGLGNPGARAFSRALGRPDFPVVVSLAGSSPSDFEAMAGMFDGVAGFEVNLSCPNAGPESCVGDDPATAGGIVRAVRRATSLPVFAKVGYGMDGAIEAVISAGADGITAVNTVPGLHVDTGSGARAGGLSGPPLLPIAVDAVRRIASRHRVPVIGCGGISSWEDAAAHMEAGAVAVQVGTAALDNMYVLGDVAAGLESHGYSGLSAGRSHTMPAAM